MLLNTTQLLTLGVAALLVFWMVGAYNRLVALRNAIGQGWAKVDEAQRQRATAAEPLLAALREPLAAELGALDALQAALAEATKAAATMTARPVVQDHATAWVAAEAALAAAAARVFALFEHDIELRSQEAITAPATAWREAHTRLGFARQLFNEAAAAYNDAVTLFPTRLLAPMFRFGVAGRL
jgi:LemA protein